MTPKGGLGAILGGGGKSDDDELDADEVTSSGKRAAVRGFMSAVKAGDEEAAQDALQSFVDLCGYGGTE